MRLAINRYKEIRKITSSGIWRKYFVAKKYNCQILDHDKDIGGRYSVFSNVGLFPAYIAGLNIEKIREGSKDIISQVQNDYLMNIILAQL